MKKYKKLTILLSLAIAFVGSPLVYAEELPSVNPKNNDIKINFGLLTKENREKINAERKAMQEKTKAKMAEFREAIKNEKDIIKAKLEEERISSREKVIQKLDKSIETLNTINTKVIAYINKIGDSGLNVTKAKELELNAEAKLDQAKKNTTEISAILTANMGELSDQNKAKLKILVEDTKNLIKDSQEALVESIQILREAVKNSSLPPILPIGTTIPSEE